VAYNTTRSTPASVTATQSLYVLNASALSKPGAMQHLSADLKSYGVSVAVITETHFKHKHTDSIISVDGYTVYRRDRVGRRGGGVAVYVAASLHSTRWVPSVAGKNSALEIEWVRLSDHMFFAALYHPPRPIYPPGDQLGFIEACVAEISHDFPMADIVLAVTGSGHNGANGTDANSPSAYPRCEPVRPCLCVKSASIQQCPGRYLSS